MSSKKVSKNQGKMDGSSKNPQEDLLAYLRKRAPEIFSEGKISPKQLKQTLGELVEEGEERYGLSWAGKSECFHHILEKTAKTVVPAREESVRFDETENLFIEGDNLEALKILEQNYRGKIKMIYIDPPYNTGNDFIYNDTFSQTKKEYLIKAGAIDEEGNIINAELLHHNTRDGGHFHSNWLNMMYPRLFLARNWLRDDGVIFVSIDDNEVANLRKVMDEIFGEENFVAQMVWAAGRKNDSRYVSVSHEYILAYAKNEMYLSENKILWRERKKGLDDIHNEFEKLKTQYKDDFERIENELSHWYASLRQDNPAKNHSHYSKVDEKGIYFSADISWPGGGGPKYEVLHPVTGKPCATPSRGWMFSDPKKMEEAIRENRVHFGPDETFVPCIKSYLRDREAQVPYSVIYQDGRSATKRLRNLLGGDHFDHPKDENIISSLIEYISVNEKSGTILDFFAGSGTTAHAVMKLNAEDGGNRKWICVQLPEICREGTEAKKAGYKNIAEIAKERIRRAAKKIKEEHPEVKIDDGFKVFKVQESNFKAWNANVKTEEELLQQLLDFRDNVLPNAKEEDLVFELLMKHGLELNAKIEKKESKGKAYFRINDGELVICLDEMSLPAFEGILESKPKKVVLLDRAFAGSDELKANILLRAEDEGVEVRTV